VDHTLDGRVLFGLGQDAARSSGVPRDAEFGVDQAALDRPGDEAIDESAGARSIRQPGVEVLLLELCERDAMVVEPVQELDRHGDGLLRSEERAVRHGFHRVHPSLQMPTDEAAYDIAVVVVAHARERAGGPLRVADGEFIASRAGPRFSRTNPSHGTGGVRVT
jgi:hypothetical protein